MRLFGVFLTILFIFFFNHETCAAEPAELWFSPLDSLLRPFNNVQGPSDFFQLFRPEAPWAKSSASIKVFKIYPDLIVRATDSDLKKIFEDLDRRKIKLALEFGVLTDSERCGHAVESYNGEHLARFALRIKRLGGTLAYLTMDEPLWYGHYYKGPNACQSDVETIARDVAQNIGPVRRIFPEIQVGDIEPVPSTEPPDWLEEIGDWTNKFSKATGQKLDFFHVDIIWKGDWIDKVNNLASLVKQKGITFGIIYNGNSEDNSDDMWLTHMREHYQAIEKYGPIPDQVIFQSWTAFPTKLLPEDNELTMTNAVLAYIESHKTHSD